MQLHFVRFAVMVPAVLPCPTDSSIEKPMKKFVFAVLFALAAPGCSDNTTTPPVPTSDTGLDVTHAEDTSLLETDAATIPDGGQGQDAASQEDTATTDVDTAEDVSQTDTNTLDTSEGDTPDGTDDADTSLPPDLSCAEHSDCGRCAYPTAPRNLDECYCVACSETVLPEALCDANREAWDTVCGETQWEPDFGPCPIPRCSVPPPTACMEGVCIDACTRADCPDLPCPLSEQRIEPGQCCPRCTGPNTCETDGDCTLCSHRNLPEEADDCRCPLCPTEAMTPETCVERSEAYNTHCDADFQLACPIPLCLPQPAPICSPTGYCEPQPYRCFQSDDCGYCPFSRAPTNPSECECAGCGTPMPTSQCEAIVERVNEVCDGFAFDACIQTPCARPPELTCDGHTGACEMTL